MNFLRKVITQKTYLYNKLISHLQNQIKNYFFKKIKTKHLNTFITLCIQKVYTYFQYTSFPLDEQRHTMYETSFSRVYIHKKRKQKWNMIFSAKEFYAKIAV